MRCALVLLLLGCTPARAPIDRELGAVPATAARVCVLRPESTAANVTMEVRDNGRLVGATRGSTFVCWLAAPGKHQITSPDDDTGPTLFQARGGSHYWLHQEVTTLGADLHAHLDWLDDAAGLEMLESCSARVRASVGGVDALAMTPAL